MSSKISVWPLLTPRCSSYCRRHLQGCCSGSGDWLMTVCTCPANQWFITLEMERNAKYIPPAPAYQPITELPPNDGINPRARSKRLLKALTLAEQQQRDKQFYDAGRFAAGARDDDAIQAMHKLNKLREAGKL